jgi:hypothetical protein
VQESSWRDALSKLLRGIDGVCVQLFLVPTLKAMPKGCTRDLPVLGSSCGAFCGNCLINGVSELISCIPFHC